MSGTLTYNEWRQNTSAAGAAVFSSPIGLACKRKVLTIKPWRCQDDTTGTDVTVNRCHWYPYILLIFTINIRNVCKQKSLRCPLLNNACNPSESPLYNTHIKRYRFRPKYAIAKSFKRLIVCRIVIDLKRVIIIGGRWKFIFRNGSLRFVWMSVLTELNANTLRIIAVYHAYSICESLNVCGSILTWFYSNTAEVKVFKKKK